ncbi:uncharacterized protein LOC109815168 [Cajanus cajan]|uniref:CCHC-type domain-containing protein n=1 Tax=Cajanus cajan TaxID=3821 RepID=A0A151RWX4_CAJCA|nr:uncharacterized protein LOC109815168 [Cajanus cajan]KYP47041.1 hypothetical protein KK1_031346 [Cajanus cajan]
MGATTAKEAWTTLQEEFEGSEKVRAVKLQTLWRNFELLNMKESRTVNDYYYRIKEIVNQMRAYGKNILDKKIMEKILISVPRKYDPIVTTIKQTKDLSTLSVTELMGSLEAYKQRLNKHDEDSTENAFQSKLKLRSHNKDKRNNGETSRNKENSRNFSRNYQNEYPPCDICKRTNHDEKDCRYRGKPQCRHCNKVGHVEKYCRNKNKHQTNFAKEKNGEQHLFCATQDSNSETSRNWYLDSDYSITWPKMQASSRILMNPSR